VRRTNHFNAALHIACFEQPTSINNLVIVDFETKFLLYKAENFISDILALLEAL
jgi:hypothetical protein